MATYAVGDIQGCHEEFRALLEHVAFDAERDVLWLTGDLVNRGPASLAVLRDVRDMGERAITVLGNHDLHLLARACGGARARRRDTLDAVLEAPDRDELLDWLRRRPLVHRDRTLGYTMVHAGLAAEWTVDDALLLGAEVSAALSGDGCAAFLDAMYGNDPDRWDASLAGQERLRFITNCLTRMRYLRPDGRLDLDEKGSPGEAGDDLVPWYEAPGRASAAERIVFGHWSTLRLDAATERMHRVYPLDTGAVWGGALTALRLEDGARFSVAASTSGVRTAD